MSWQLQGRTIVNNNSNRLMAKILGKRKRSYGSSYKSKRRRVSRRSRRRYNALSQPLRSSLLKSVPDRLFVTLKYNDRITIDPGSVGSLKVHRFSLNSCHDPDMTGTGHQPRYWDQLCNSIEGNGLFHKYKVHACAFSIKMINGSNKELQTFCVATPHGNTIANGDDPDAVFESSRCATKILSNSDGGTPKCQFGGKLLIKAVEGVRNLDDSNYNATYGNSPGFQPQLAFGAVVMDEASSVTGDCYAEITVYYKVELFDRIFKSTVN